MFQTLVDVNERVPEIWKGILEDEYTKEKDEIGAKAIMNNLSSSYEKAINPFANMEKMFIECASNAIKETGYEVSPEKVAYHLMYQHGHAPFYEEVLATISELSKEYRIIICSDCSRLMVNSLLKKCNVEKVFISDDIGCYKGESGGSFFEKVLSDLKVSPEKILHVGDSSADIIGAHGAKIDACWINRDDREWKHTEKPDFVIHNLEEILDIIEKI